MSKAIRKILSDPKKLDSVVKIAFEAVDEDHNGYIDYRELTKILIKLALDMGVNPPTPNEVHEVLEVLDSNGNGYLEMEEFKILLQALLIKMVMEE